MRALKVIALAGTAFVALATSALAADLPVKAARPIMTAAPAFSWTGWDVGINGGYHVSPGDTIHNSGELLADEVTIQSDPGKLARNGGLVGAQIGYNWQVAPTWLTGLEADWQWLSGTSNNLCTGECFKADFITPETKVNWLATFRGRL